MSDEKGSLACLGGSHWVCAGKCFDNSDSGFGWHTCACGCHKDES